jgi:hypothetical protein
MVTARSAGTIQFRGAGREPPGSAAGGDAQGLRVGKLSQLERNATSIGCRPVPPRRGLSELCQGDFNQALALLTIGEFRRGFEKYEWLRPTAGSENIHWKRRKILLHAELGLGDTIQFAR